jgi:hypothetical protein
MTPSGIKTGTFRFVAQHLNRATAVPQITDRYTWKTGKQQVRGGEKSGGERIMEPMNEHPHRRYNAKITSQGHGTVSSIKPKS